MKQQKERTGKEEKERRREKIKNIITHN